MVLAARPVHFPAYAPIDEATRPELLELGTAVLLAENVRPTETGGYETRRGHTFQTLTRVDATTRSAGYRQFAHGPGGKQTCIVDGSVLDSHSSANAANVSRGRVPDCGLSMMKVPTPGVTGSLTCTDSVRVGDYLALAYTAGTSVYASLVEASTGQVIVVPTLLYTGTASEIYGLLTAQGTTARIFIVCSGETDIQERTIDCSTATTAYAGWSTSGLAVADNGGLAMAVHSIGTRAYLAYVNNSGGTSRVTVKMYDGGAGGSTTINTSSVTPGALGLGGGLADTLWVAWNETTSVRVRGLSTTNMATTLATTATVIAAASAPSDLGSVHVVDSATAGAGRLFVHSAQLQTRNFTTSAGAVTAGAATANHYNVFMAGKPFRISARYYGVCRGYDNQERVAILCDLTDANAWVRPVANVAPRLASSFAACQAAQHTTREFWAPIGVQTAGNVTGLQMARFDFDAVERWLPVAHNGVTFLSGGLLSYFDGVRVAESNFVIRPPAAVLATNGVGTFTATGAGLRVVFVYEQVDAAGNWHVSGVSDPTLIAAFSNKINLEVTARPLGVSGRISAATDPSVRISIYMTPDGGNPPYYYVASLTNTLTAATQTYNITGHVAGTTAKLYAPSLPGVNGGSQDHRAPPGLMHIEAGNGVLVGALGEDVWCSSQDVSGEGIWWSPAFQVPVSGDGDITGIKFQDGAFYIFKRRAIYALGAEPPADNGSAGGLGAPVRLAVDVGCIDARSLVATSLGIFFQSERGIEILTRARSVEYVGERVKDTVGSFPICTSATVDPLRDVVYFEFASAQSSGLVTGTGRTLVFHLTQKAWISTDRRPSYSGVADTPAQSGCMIWDGTTYRYAWLQTDGRVRPETSNYYDTGSADSFIVPRVEYPAFKLGLQQRTRVWRGVWLVERLSAAGFKVEHLYDWATAYSSSDDKTWTEAQTASKRQLHWTLKTGERQAVRFRVSATAPATLGTGRAFALVGFSLDVAPKQGSTKGTPNLDPSARQ